MPKRDKPESSPEWTLQRSCAPRHNAHRMPPESRNKPSGGIFGFRYLFRREKVWYTETDNSEFVEISMIVPVNETNLLQAATIHSISWKESHRAFCTPDFIETHTPDRQREYLRNKMNNGTKLYMLVEEKPIGVVSVTKGLIEDLYILPDMQNMGHGTKLLLYAVGQCTDTPTLWILENNINAERLYRRIGFKETGRKNAITNKLDEIEFTLT